MIYYPKDNNIEDYTIAIVASNNVFNFLRQNLIILKNQNIKYKNICIADAGLLEEQKKFIVELIGNKVSFYNCNHKNYDVGFKTQSNEYRKIIDNRISFLKYLINNNIERILQLDADTAIISNNFCMLNKAADVSLTVRPVTPDDHILGQFQVDYPNCGVIFWNNSKRCLDFINYWEEYKDNNPPKGGQYEQNYFLHATLSEQFNKLNVQKIHCAYYNCYKREWINRLTSILHYKGNSSLFGPGGGTFEKRSEYLNSMFVRK